MLRGGILGVCLPRRSRVCHGFKNHKPNANADGHVGKVEGGPVQLFFPVQVYEVPDSPEKAPVDHVAKCTPPQQPQAALKQDPGPRDPVHHIGDYPQPDKSGSDVKP